MKVLKDPDQVLQIMNRWQRTHDPRLERRIDRVA